MKKSWVNTALKTGLKMGACIALGTSFASAQRAMEYLDRGVVAVRSGNDAFISWRSLATDDDNMAFNVYRETNGQVTKLNSAPLTQGTNFTEKNANFSSANKYFVKSVLGGVESDTDGSYTMPANKGSGEYITVPIKQGGIVHFVWVGDLNGDGSYDYVLDRPVDEHQKLEAYTNEGKFLWELDLGVNSENKNNISPGASTIDVGMWDGATVYDIDLDGKAEVLVRIADGVTFGDGKTFKLSGTNKQVIAVLDGETGALKYSAPVPEDFIDIGPMATMMEIGYLDGKTPSLICWMKNRNPNKSFNSLMVAYHMENGEFKQQWKFNNNKGYPEAHQIRIADVDYDGKDEVLHMGYAINGDGSLRYVQPEIVHGDRWYVGAFNKGDKEMMGYGVQQDHPNNLLEYYYNASTGEMIWTHYGPESCGGQCDVGRGNIGDIDPTHPGYEVWSFEGTYNGASGKKVADGYMYPVIRLWWDGDLFSESYNDGKIEKWDYQNQSVGRAATTWKIYPSSGSERGAGMFHGDILGDWREESILVNYDAAQLVIFTTNIPTDYRFYSLVQNPAYRNHITTKGYVQAAMLDYYLGDGMDMPAKPNITIVPKGGIQLPPAPSLTKHGAASSNQTVAQGSAIEEFYYTVAGATSASVTGLPEGVNGQMKGSDFYISGTVSKNVVPGVYKFTVKTSEGDATATGSVTVTLAIDPNVNLKASKLNASRPLEHDGVAADIEREGYEEDGYINFQNKVGSYGIWEIESEFVGELYLTIRYCNGNSAKQIRSMSLDVNGSVQDIAFNPSADWVTWDETTVKVTVAKGKNTLKLISLDEGGGPNIDMFYFSEEGLKMVAELPPQITSAETKMPALKISMQQHELQLQGFGKVALFDMQGRVLLKQNVNGNLNIATEKFGNQTVLLNFYGKSGKTSKVLRF